MLTQSWDTSCIDWETRILEGRSLVPELPLFPDEAAKALRVFKRLRLPDVIGTPTLGEVCGEWPVTVSSQLSRLRRHHRVTYFVACHDRYSVNNRS